MVAISVARPTRRTVLSGSLGMAGTMMLGAGGQVFAADELKGKTVVFASWGGAYQDAE